MFICLSVYFRQGQWAVTIRLYWAAASGENDRGGHWPVRNVWAVRLLRAGGGRSPVFMGDFF